MVKWRVLIEVKRVLKKFKKVVKLKSNKKIN